MNRIKSFLPRSFFLPVFAVVLLLGGVGVGPAWAGNETPGVGQVDGTRFIDLVGDDAVRLEVTVGKSLLTMISRADPELEELASGLDSIYALILDLEDPGAANRARKVVREIESSLVDEGWERLARVRDDDAEIKVLVRNNDELMQGLVVMIFSTEEEVPQLIFANIAGSFDPASIRTLGEGFGVPGLRGIQLDETSRSGE